MAETATADKPPAASIDTFESLFERYGKFYRALAVASVGMGAIATVLASTNINVALPSVMGAFGIGQEKAQWLSSGYLAASTVTMLMAAWMIQRWGIRWAFVFNMLTFIAGSLLGAVSPNPEVLIVARFIQGAAAGIFLPLAMVVLGRVFPPQQQGLAMGLFGIITVMAPAVGPVTGGILIDHFNWRFVFFLALPLALLSLPMAMLFLPDKENPDDKPSLDIASTTMLSLFVVALLLGLSNGQDKGWSSDYTLTCLLVVVVCAGGFIHRQLHIPAPLLNLSLFRFPSFCLAAVISVVLGAGLYGSTYTTPLFLQTIQGLNATNAGFVLLPAGLVLAIFFPITGFLSDRISPRLMIMSGLILFALSSYLMVPADRQTPTLDIIIWLIFGRLGLAMIMPALNVATLNPLPLHLVPQASGSSNFLRQMGGALGVNLSSIYLERRTALHMDSLAASQHQGNPQTTEMLGALREPLQQAGVDITTQDPLAFYILFQELGRQAMTAGFQDTFAVTTVVFLAAVFPATYLRAKKKSN